MRYWDEMSGDGFGVAFAQAALDRLIRDGTDLFRIPNIAEQAQFAA